MSNFKTGVALTFGLISTTVHINSAKQTEERFRLVCNNGHEPTPIKQPKVCPYVALDGVECGPISNPSLLRHMKPNGELVEESVADSLKEDASQFKKKLSLVAYNSGQVQSSTVQGDMLYVLTPQASEEHYHIIATLIAENPDKAFLAQFTPKTRVGLFVARVNRNVIMLEERTHQERLKPLPLLEPSISDTMMAAGRLMMPAFVNEFDLDTYREKYLAALETVNHPNDSEILLSRAMYLATR